MLIETISGYETFPGGSETRILLFYRNSATEEDMPLADAARKVGGGVSSIGSPNTMLACEANKNHGAWTIARYAIRENSLINVRISKKLPGDFIKQTKQLMLYNRPAAALRRIAIPFSGHLLATRDNGYLEGRFDILTLEQIADMGVELTEIALAQFAFNDDEANDFYEERIIEAEKENLLTAQNEAVITEKGNTVRIARPRRRVIVPS